MCVCVCVCVCVCASMCKREREKERMIGNLDFRHVKFEMLVQYPNGNVQWTVGSLELWGMSSTSM